MRKSTTMKRITAGDRHKILGEFKNEYGEEYVIFAIKMENNKLGPIFITGDELDWEIGYNVSIMNGKIGVNKPHLLDQDETEKIASVLEKNKLVKKSGIITPDKDKSIHFKKEQEPSK